MLKTLESEEAALLDYLEANKGRLIDLLGSLVNEDSFSTDKKDVDSAGEVVKRFWTEMGIPVEVRPSETFGEALIGRVGAGENPILLMGHRDTVFPAGEAGARPFRIKNGRGYGPGVNDMKGGVAVNMMVMAAFKQCVPGGPPIVGLITGDEELASPFSRPVIEELARQARVVFNSEPARVNGNVVTARKGGRFMLLEVWGRPAHSGVNFFDGASAIEELALKIAELRRVTDEAAGTTLNTGLIRGGQTVNTVPPYAAAELDLRFVDNARRDDAMKTIGVVVENCTIAGTSAKLTIAGEFLPLVPTEASTRLFEFYKHTAAQIGIELDGEFTGSCADSGFASSQGVPTLCGTGPVGNKSHTPDEYVEVETIAQRAKVLALTIYRLSRNPEMFG